MHGPDGVDYPNRIVHSEIVAPERLSTPMARTKRASPESST
jgi:hypothetical protein